MLKSISRLGLALLLLAGMVYFVGVGDLLRVLAHIQLQYLLILVALSAVFITITCIKWRLFIRAWGHDEPLLQLMRIYTITYFYNVFAPSFLVSDVARSYHLGKRIQNQRDAFVATFLERLTGFLAMILLGTIFVGFGAEAAVGLEAAILAVAFLGYLAALICFSKTAFDLSARIALALLRIVGLSKLGSKVEQLFSAISRAVDAGRNNPVLFLKAMFWSLIFHFGTVINTYFAALAVGWNEPNFTGLCVVVPLVLLVSVAPITPSGIGLQEGAFLFFLERVGATGPEALGVALVLRAKNLVTAFVGWLLWLTLKSPKGTESAASQNAAARTV